MQMDAAKEEEQQDRMFDRRQAVAKMRADLLREKQERKKKT